mmetsp:Transcript_28759/g.48975  ORF Transcript_28759/g.48975 Transcript_28759/m.48975 type:complete len:201 (-) Transcript_28759:80-682(-)
MVSSSSSLKTMEPNREPGPGDSALGTRSTEPASDCDEALELVALSVHVLSVWSLTVYEETTVAVLSVVAIRYGMSPKFGTCTGSSRGVAGNVLLRHAGRAVRGGSRADSGAGLGSRALAGPLSTGTQFRRRTKRWRDHSGDHWAAWKSAAYIQPSLSVSAEITFWYPRVMGVVSWPSAVTHAGGSPFRSLCPHLVRIKDR